MNTNGHVTMHVWSRLCFYSQWTILETSFPRLYTNLMTVPNLTFTELRGFHGAFETGVASHQGALTLPDTWFRPSFWDLLMLQLLRPNSSTLPCLCSTFHLEYPLVLSRFLLCKRFFPREDAWGLSREYVLRIPSVS